MTAQIINDVKTYYGETLTNSSDLQTSACCPTGSLPDYLKPLLADIHPKIQQKFYGCGSPIPNYLANQTILDFGHTADILQQSKYAPLFKVTGDKSAHYGLFNCHTEASQRRVAANFL